MQAACEVGALPWVRQLSSNEVYPGREIQPRSVNTTHRRWEMRCLDPDGVSGQDGIASPP